MPAKRRKFSSQFRALADDDFAEVVDIIAAALVSDLDGTAHRGLDGRVAQLANGHPQYAPLSTLQDKPPGSSRTTRRNGTKPMPRFG